MDRIEGAGRSDEAGTAGRMEDRETLGGAGNQDDWKERKESKQHTVQIEQMSFGLTPRGRILRPPPRLATSLQDHHAPNRLFWIGLSLALVSPRLYSCSYIRVYSQ